MDQGGMNAMNVYAPHIASAEGTVLSAKGDNDAGNAAAYSAKLQANQLRQAAGQEMAAATVAAQEEQRKKDLIASRAIALAAASGGGTVDPSVVRILQGIEAEGQLATDTQLYNGAESARGLNMQADAAKYQGDLYKRFYKSRALSTVLAGGNKLANTWGSGSFKDSQKQPGSRDVGSTPVGYNYA